MKRDIGLDYIRIILTLMIVTFHFCEANGLYSSVFFTMANGTWGWVATTSFVLLSGYLLRTIYRDKLDVIKFYKKRLLTLFPSFYVAFAICFVIHAACLGSPFYGGHPAKIILSFLGIDSYVSLYGISTYSVVGEWFTGLIIMLYVAYPVLNLIMNKTRLFPTIILFAIYIVNVIYGIDPTIKDASFITGVFIIWCGMLIAEYSDIVKRYWLAFIPIMSAFVALAIIPLNIPMLFTSNALGVLLFAGLLMLFSKITFGKTNKAFSYLSIISYEVYLVHHFVLYKMAAVFEGKLRGIVPYAAYYCLLLVMIILFAMIIHFIADKIKKLLTYRKGTNHE